MRENNQQGKSLFLDMLDKSTGELVGMSGFRLINFARGLVEWGGGGLVVG